MDLTVTQFVEMAQDREAHEFAGVETHKMEKTLKKHRETGEPVVGVVTSETTYNPVVGLTYRTTVNNRLEKEGKNTNFVPKELPWGQWIGTGSTIIEHKGQYYLRLSLVGKNGTKKQFFLNGQPVERRQIAAILPATKRSTNEHQGLENPVIVVNVKVSTITRLAMGGETYRINGAGTLVNPA